jgi:hypothetical protein
MEGGTAVRIEGDQLAVRDDALLDQRGSWRSSGRSG